MEILGFTVVLCVCCSLTFLLGASFQSSNEEHLRAEVERLEKRIRADVVLIVNLQDQLKAQEKKK